MQTGARGKAKQIRLLIKVSLYSFLIYVLAVQTSLHVSILGRESPKHEYKPSMAELVHDPKKRINVFNKTCQFEYDALPPGLGVSYAVSLFYHIGMLNNWRQIVLDQLDTLEYCGLGYIASDMTISFHNVSPNQTETESSTQILELLNQYRFASRLLSNITFLDASMSSPHERLILERMSLNCRSTDHPTSSNRTRIINFYFHDKGCSKHSETPGTEEYETSRNIFYWRKYMEWFLLERPTLCLRAILHHGSQTCGVDLRGFPSMHYSGNFWSASCDYVKELPIQDAWPDEQTNGWLHYLSAEMWIGNFTYRSVDEEKKFLSLFNIMAILYNYRATPDVYNWILRDRTFYQGNHTSYFQAPGWEGCDDCNRGYDSGNQTELWEDYIVGLQAVDP